MHSIFISQATVFIRSIFIIPYLRPFAISVTYMLYSTNHNSLFFVTTSVPYLWGDAGCCHESFVGIACDNVVIVVIHGLIILNCNRVHPNSIIKPRYDIWLMSGYVQIITNLKV